MQQAQGLEPWLRLCHTKGIGPATFHKLLAGFGHPSRVLDASVAELSAAGLNQQIISELQRKPGRGFNETLAWLQQEDAYIFTLEDEEYPAYLRTIPDPPPILYVFGSPAVLSRPQLAVVGSRNPSQSGLETAAAFARELTTHGLVVTSGLALGIDAASHQGALQNGYTVAVVGTGLDRVYPARHRDLAHEISRRGALVSEFPLGMPPQAGNFPRRNRIISGLSQGVLVVEASLQSGSLITARLALDYNREVMAIPGSIHNPRARGCNWLIRQGARLVETVADILEEIQWSVSNISVGDAMAWAETDLELDPDQQTVLAAIDYEPTSVDKVILQSGLTPESVCSMLLVLELHGLVERMAGGLLQRTAKRTANEREHSRCVDVSV